MIQTIKNILSFVKGYFLHGLVAIMCIYIIAGYIFDTQAQEEKKEKDYTWSMNSLRIIDQKEEENEEYRNQKEELDKQKEELNKLINANKEIQAKEQCKIDKRDVNAVCEQGLN